MNILITGSKGQLGSQLIRMLEDNKSELGTLPSCYRNADVTSLDIDTLDITCADSVHEYFTGKQYEIIINCAAMTNVDACETDPEAAMKANATGARSLALAASQMGGKFVHISTDYVFSGDADSPYREWDATAPNTVYGKSKLLGEQYVSSVCPQSFIIRTAWLYGREGSNFVKTIMRLIAEKDELNVVDDQRGSPTNAVDLAHHILQIAATEGYGIYHCTGSGQCSWYDFACEIARLSEAQCKIIPCTTEEYPRPAPRPAYSVLDNLMLRCTLGDGMRHWKDALASYMKSY